MEHLKDLIRIISKHKVKGLKTIGGAEFQNSKLQKLYDGIQEGVFLTDRDAELSIYQNNKNRNQNLTKLKSRLQQRLINTIFFIDINKSMHNDIQMAYYSCHKEWAAVKILIGKGARLTAIPIAEKLFEKALKFEFSHIIIDIARVLRIHYSTINSNKAKYHKYNTHIKKQQEVLDAELLAEEYYSIIASNFKNPDFNTQDKIHLAVKLSDGLRIKTKNLNSYRLNLSAMLVHVYRYQVVNDYKNVIKECQKAIQFFESKPHQASKVAIFTFLFKMLACYIQLKQFKKGEEVAMKCLEVVSEGTPNWFYTHELLITLCLHTQKFQAAYDNYLKVFQNKNFNRLYTNSTENWKIYEAYINYFITNGEIEIDQKQSPLKKFRINKFINEVPIYSKDKRGKNIPILIIHILFLLQQHKFNAVIDRVEALNQYTYRYLRKDDTYRSNCFIKMLIQLPSANFHKQAVIRKTSQYQEKLKLKPLEISGQFDEIEIVPYEILWGYVLDALDNKFH